jgi:hypothetical protein
VTFQHEDSQPLATAYVPDKLWYRIDVASKILGVPETSLRRWARLGKIHAHQPGGKSGVWLIHYCAVEHTDLRPAAQAG